MPCALEGCHANEVTFAKCFEDKIEDLPKTYRRAEKGVTKNLTRPPSMAGSHCCSRHGKTSQGAVVRH